VKPALCSNVSTSFETVTAENEKAAETEVSTTFHRRPPVSYRRASIIGARSWPGKRAPISPSPARFVPQPLHGVFRPLSIERAIAENAIKQSRTILLRRSGLKRSIVVGSAPIYGAFGERLECPR
jgi:hypothetical protein